MKSKYQGICTWAMAALVLTICAGYFLSGAWRLAPRQPDGSQAPVLDVKAPSEDQARDMQALLPRMAALASPAAKSSEHVALSLLGWRPADEMDARIADRRDQKSGSDYRLSLTLLSGARRFCILDGALLPEGATLPDGACVTRIENRCIQISNVQTTRWICLNDTRTVFESAQHAEAKDHL